MSTGSAQNRVRKPCFRHFTVPSLAPAAVSVLTVPAPAFSDAEAPAHAVAAVRGHSAFRQPAQLLCSGSVIQDTSKSC